MDDPELAALRQQRLAQMQSQYVCNFYLLFNDFYVEM